MTIRTLVVTRGHRFERDAFYAMFEALPDVDACHVEHPAAQVFFDPERARDWDVFVLYDMPGIQFHPDRRPPAFLSPPDAYADGFRRLLDAGHGFVFLHHALAGWPAWDHYADIMGGRFHYQPTDRLPDSGYQLGVAEHISVVNPGHPVVEGLGEGFDLVDEVYLADVFEDQVEPLLRSDFAFEPQNFFSAANAVAGRRNSNEGWSHPSGTNLVGWVRPHPTSRIVYLQPGDGAQTYGHPAYRRLLGNAIAWVADHHGTPAARGTERQEVGGGAARN